MFFQTNIRYQQSNIFFWLFQVVSSGTTNGPENVLVTLTSVNDKTLNLVTTTKENGQYEFGPILNGQYLITAKNDNYKFSKSSTSFTVEENNLIVPDGSLVISGYDVSGQVLFNGEPTVGVTFVLFANDEVNDNNNNNDYLHSYSKFIYFFFFFN